MHTDEMRSAYSYALAKQLDSAHTLETSYGSIDLDDEMRNAIAAVLRPILESRLKGD